MNYWLVKSEPFKYSWDELVKDKWTYWDGVRNYAARLHMKAMKVGDLVLYYHSNEGLEVVGYARVIKEHYQDPTTDDDRWVAMDIEPVEALKNPVTLKQIKADAKLKDMALVKISRLSVSPVTNKEFDHILKLGL
ncbi:MAG TPA: EVE domain-containing protein [Flavobacteriales bacterium]|jgi:predicted RNA-binding protein with PUA-like domain|nr:EVE domain-containing protein [Flavobacteriales bacterium]